MSQHLFKALKSIHNQQPRVITTDKYAATEAMHMIRKGQVEEIQCALSEVEFFNRIMGVMFIYIESVALMAHSKKMVVIKYDGGITDVQGIY